MRKCIVFLLFVMLLPWSASAKRQPKPVEVDSLGRKIKTGWNFGILPSVAYDADCGFQGGALANVYYYGDGSQYPEYIHSMYMEAAYTTTNSGVFRFRYDSKYLIPNHNLVLDATYLPDAMCDFYGYNGYQSVYNQAFHSSAYHKVNGEQVYNPDKMDMAAYQTRAFYKFRRDLVRIAGDIEGTIYKNLKWNAGLGVLGYINQEVQIDKLNRNKKGDKRLPEVKGLYQKYLDWGIMSREEANGGWHPYVRVGLTYDSRDKRQGPNSGIYADAFLTYTAAFNASYGQQASAGFNHLQINANFRHYVPCYRDRVIFAYRIGIQNNIAGKSPFYQNTYLNTLFIQRMIYEGLGGGSSLRGVLRHRILANGFAFANIEFRFRVVDFDIKSQHFYIGLNPFFDLGMVTQPMKVDEQAVRQAMAEDEEVQSKGWQVSDFFNFKSSEIYRPHMAAGLGLKVAMNENFVLSVDWAMPVNEKHYIQQDNAKWANFYVKMGYLF